MKTQLTYSGIADVQTECLVAVILDHNADKRKDAKPNVKAASSDKALAEAIADDVASGDVTGKSLETTLLHGPKGLMAKRLLIIGGGKAAKFTSDDVRKIAGTAVRFVNGKNLTSLAIAVPEAASVSAADG